MNILKILINVPGLLEHSLNVFQLTRRVIDCLSDELVSKQQAEDLLMAAIYHDIGKVTWPKSWFTKTRNQIQSTELIVMKTHPIQSINFLKESHIVITPGTEELILHHHERPNRKGYPYEIEPDFQTLILAACDTFDLSINSQSSKKLTINQAIDQIDMFASEVIIDALRCSAKDIVPENIENLKMGGDYIGKSLLQRL